jgi:hypothetical protein
MYRDDDLTLAPLFMLVPVKAAAVLGQPFPKCGTFHCFVPIYQVLNCVEPGSASLETWALCEILRRFVDLRQTTEMIAHGLSRQIPRWNLMSAFGGTADIARSGHQMNR